MVAGYIGNKMNTYNKLITVGKTVMAVSMLLILTACKQDFTLQDTDGVIVGIGALEFNANFPAPAYFTINERKFSGSWSSDKVYEEDLAKRHRLISSRSYDAYMQGNTADQLRHGHAAMAAQDGAKMECDFYYRTRPKLVDCNVDGRLLKLTMPD